MLTKVELKEKKKKEMVVPIYKQTNKKNSLLFDTFQVG